MAYTLPALPYAFDALEPHIDKLTMEIHHDRHHAAYVTNVNKALEEHADLAALPVEKLIADLEKVPEAIRTVVRNNGGGHANHSLFWETLGKGKGGEPSGHLAEAVRSVFGGFDTFKEQFTKAAGPGCPSTPRASSSSRARPIRTAPSCTATFPCWASTCGSTPTI
jgi:Fe-Mn family superoxide dismutase